MDQIKIIRLHLHPPDHPNTLRPHTGAPPFCRANAQDINQMIILRVLLSIIVRERFFGPILLKPT